MDKIARKKQLLLYLNTVDNPKVIVGEDIQVFEDVMQGFGRGGVPVNFRVTRNGLEVYKSTTTIKVDSDGIIFESYKKGQVLPLDKIDKEELVSWVTQQLQILTRNT